MEGLFRLLDNIPEDEKNGIILEDINLTQCLYLLCPWQKEVIFLAVLNCLLMSNIAEKKS